jgi:hypothetical protein
LNFVHSTAVCRKEEVVPVIKYQSKKSYDVGVIAAPVAMILIGVVYAVTVGFGLGPDELSTLIALPP